MPVNFPKHLHLILLFFYVILSFAVVDAGLTSSIRLPANEYYYLDFSVGPDTSDPLTIDIPSFLRMIQDIIFRRLGIRGERNSRVYAQQISVDVN